MPIFGMNTSGMSRREKICSFNSDGRDLKTFCENMNKYKKTNSEKTFQKIVNGARVKRLVRLFATKISRSVQKPDHL